MTTFFKEKNSVREPAVAGQFYPENQTELKNSVLKYMDDASGSEIIPRGFIVPHAGYSYSGAVAGSAYKIASLAKKHYKRVVLIGPAHRVYVDTVALHSASNFKSPLGLIPIDQKAILDLAKTFNLTPFNEAHIQEHSLEVQLPFIQLALPKVKLIPMVVGHCNINLLAEILEFFWNEETLYLISSDLSHFHDYETAVKMDSTTTKQIIDLDYESIGLENACGCLGIKAFLKVAKNHNLKVEAIDVRNSGDASGSHDSVVGYGSFAFWEN
ncbi:MAG: AmmeMemoRadiSam system protein B [Leptospirales bacterium]